MIPMGGIPPRGATVETMHLRTCQRCHVAYDFRRSTSRWLKLTYCGSLCEQGALGFTIEALLENMPSPPEEPAPEAAEPELLAA